MSIHENNGFARKPLGQLRPTEEQKLKFEHPREEKLTDTSDERKVLLEDFRSGYIDHETLREELAKLKDQE